MDCKVTTRDDEPAMEWTWDVNDLADLLAAAVLNPDYPLVVVVHDESECQMRNPFEQMLIEPIVRALADKTKHGWTLWTGWG